MKFTFLFAVSIFTLFSCANNKIKKEEVAPINTETKISYLLDIKPIIDNNCTSCHDENATSIPNWKNSAKLKEYALKSSGIDGYTEIQARIKGKKERMPLGSPTPLSDIDIAKIDAWISQGASIE